jgi:hypothetical protein
LLEQLLRAPQTVRHLAETINGLHTHYDQPTTAIPSPVASAQTWTLQGTDRIPVLLRDGRPLVLDLADSEPLRQLAAEWAGRVNVVTTTCRDHNDLAALLVRPDGHLAWASRLGPDIEQARSALTRWFGTPAAGSKSTGP